MQRNTWNTLGQTLKKSKAVSEDREGIWGQSKMKLLILNVSRTCPQAPNEPCQLRTGKIIWSDSHLRPNSITIQQHQQNIPVKSCFSMLVFSKINSFIMTNKCRFKTLSVTGVATSPRLLIENRPAETCTWYLVRPVTALRTDSNWFCVLDSKLSSLMITRSFQGHWFSIDPQHWP